MVFKAQLHCGLPAWKTHLSRCYATGDLYKQLPLTKDSKFNLTMASERNFLDTEIETNILSKIFQPLENWL